MKVNPSMKANWGTKVNSGIGARPTAHDRAMESALGLAMACPHHACTLSDQGRRLVDRRQAGRLLAATLSDFAGTDAVVLGVPCGGLPVAAEVARVLRLPLGVALAHKVRASLCGECAVGAISVNGHYVRRSCPCGCSLHTPALSYPAALRGEWKTLRLRRALYDNLHLPPMLRGRTVILVDDLAMSGATLLAALSEVREADPARVGIAVPAAPAEAVRTLAPGAAFVRALNVVSAPISLHALYRHSAPVLDEEVSRLLCHSSRSRWRQHA